MKNHSVLVLEDFLLSGKGEERRQFRSLKFGIVAGEGTSKSARTRKSSQLFPTKCPSHFCNMDY